jgi:hypothetical protein
MIWLSAGERLGRSGQDSIVAEKNRAPATGRNNSVMSAHKLLSRRLLWVALVGVPFLVPAALAQQPAEDSAPVAYDGLGTLWVLLAAFLVFFMQAGFGMVEAGLIRAKNSANILMKNLMDFCLGFIPLTQVGALG